MKRVPFFLLIFIILISCNKDDRKKSVIIVNEINKLEKQFTENSDNLDEMVYEINIDSSAGGNAYFENNKTLSSRDYFAKAVAKEGYFFDQWKISRGSISKSIYSKNIKIRADSNGVSVKALFLPLNQTIFVSSDFKSRGLGTKKEPYKSIYNAVNDGVKRINESISKKVEIRVANGTYYLSNYNLLELTPGLSIRGSYNPISWRNEDFNPKTYDSKSNATIIRILPSYNSDSIIFVNRGNQNFSAEKRKILIDSLVIDVDKKNKIIVNATNVSLTLSNSVLYGNGRYLIGAFDCSVTVENTVLHSRGNNGYAIHVEPASFPGIKIIDNKIIIGSEKQQIENGNGIFIYSSKGLNEQRIFINRNHIVSYVYDLFEGISVENGSLVCDLNRIENGISAKSSIGMDIKGKAVVNRNTIILNSERGFGLSLKGSSVSSRVLNNTIVTESSNSRSKMTACGNIVGDDLLIKNNIFVNPSNEFSSALGNDLLNGNSRIYNNSVISNNRKEKNLIIGHNGNIDTLPDRITGATISQTGVEVKREPFP